MNKSATLMLLALAGALTIAHSSRAAGPIPDSIGADYTRDIGQGLLVTAAPYPSNRVDDPRRAQNGRLWVPRTPIGTRTPIRESVYGQPGPASYGAPVGAIDDVIYVQTREPLPIVAVSPWVNLDTQTIKHLRRERPWIRRAPGVVEDLRRAQNQWLTEQGYIQKVRTHVNPASLEKPSAGARGARGADILPRAVIRVKQRFTKPPEIQARSTPADTAETGA